MINEVKLAALDFETGGKDPYKSAITGVGLVFFCYIPNEMEAAIIGKKSWLVNPDPKLAVTAEAMAIQGRDATNIFSGEHTPEAEMVEHVTALYNSHGRPPIVCHNAEFESGFLRALLGRHDAKDYQLGSFLCTQRLTAYARSIAALPRGRNDFNTALSEFGLKRSNAELHDAGEDAELTAELFCQLSERLGRYFRGEVHAYV